MGRSGTISISGRVIIISDKKENIKVYDSTLIDDDTTSCTKLLYKKFKDKLELKNNNDKLMFDKLKIYQNMYIRILIYNWLIIRVSVWELNTYTHIHPQNYTFRLYKET